MNHGIFCCLLPGAWRACRHCSPDRRAPLFDGFQGSNTLKHTYTQHRLHTRGVYEQLKAALQLPAECVHDGKFFF